MDSRLCLNASITETNCCDRSKNSNLEDKLAAFTETYENKNMYI